MRAPRVSASTTYVQKSRSSVTSTASCCSPSRLDRVAAPARSWLLKIRPTRPRAAWLWLVWRASVDLPESMVPVKNCSSATGSHHQHRDQHLHGGERPVQADQGHLVGERRAAHHGEVAAGGDHHVTEPGTDHRGDLPEPA